MKGVRFPFWTTSFATIQRRDRFRLALCATCAFQRLRYELLVWYYPRSVYDFRNAQVSN
jgi:hypothetical protein